MKRSPRCPEARAALPLGLSPAIFPCSRFWKLVTRRAAGDTPRTRSRSRKGTRRCAIKRGITARSMDRNISARTMRQVPTLFEKYRIQCSPAWLRLHALFQLVRQVLALCSQQITRCGGLGTLRRTVHFRLTLSITGQITGHTEGATKLAAGYCLKGCRLHFGPTSPQIGGTGCS